MGKNVPDDITALIRSLLIDKGFSDVGFTRVQHLGSYVDALSAWLHKGYHGEMSFMERYAKERANPGVLVPGAKSVVVALFNYYPKEKQSELIPQVAKYAYGRDYHKILKKKLTHVVRYLSDQFGINGRAFVDSAPLMEKPMGEMAGLGWIGKNGCLISPRIGSFFVMGELVLDCELEYDKPAVMACGSCRKCIDACPTQAIVANGVIDSNKCLSYLTIEKKSDELVEVDELHNRIFGCDICQDVCPWNKKSKPTSEVDFAPRNNLLEMTIDEWKAISENEFKASFAGSPIYRAGHKGINRSLRKLSNDDSTNSEHT